MARAAAFLRAINVGSHTVRMQDLRRIFVGLGLNRVETFIASGNVVFDTTARNLAALERTIETQLAAALGYDVAAFVRTIGELADLAAFEPFEAELVARAPTACLAFVGRTPDRAAVSRIRAAESAAHRFHIKGPHVYWLSSFRQSEPGFSKVSIERLLGQPATLRGVRTIRRMAARYAPAAGKDRS